MATEFSDPNWWPTPPPKPPKMASTPMLIFGTLLPMGIIALLVVALLFNKHHSTAVTGHSYAAFESCLSSQGGFTASVSANSRLMRQVAVACRSHLPPGTQVSSATASTGSASAEEAFQRCLQAIVGNQGGGGTGGPGGRFGRFGGGPSRQAFHNAIATCHALEPQTGGGGGGGQGSTGGQTPQV